MNMVHERLTGTTLPVESLLFEGSTYDLGWDGRRGNVDHDFPGLPTADFALFLVNAVKFHVCQLFHLFDESTFMYYFKLYYDDPTKRDRYPDLWYIHFLLILAFGKAFIVRTGKGRTPPGADLFIQAMKLLPDMTFVRTDPVQAIELLSCAALYLQCLDLRSSAYNMVRFSSLEQGSC